MRCHFTALILGLGLTILPQAEGGGPKISHVDTARGQSWQRNHPSHIAETSARGWTVRSEHFVVLATTSRDDAALAAGELERTWTQISRLADHWTDVHRRPGFGVGAVSVVLADHARHPRSQPAFGPSLANPDPQIQLNLADGPWTLQDRLPQLRAEAFSAFVDLAGQNLLLPPWVQTGLASYFSGEPLPPPGTLSQLTLPEPFVPPTKGAWARRAFEDRGLAAAPSQQQAGQAAYWVRYLLEGDDAAHAYSFFDALGTAVAKGSRDDLSATQKARAVEPKIAARPPQDPVDIERLAGTVLQNGAVSEWLADPNVGQPIVASEPKDLPLDERHREMVLILKLAQRFGRDAATTTTTTTKVYEQGVQLAEESPAKTDVPDLPRLYRQLSDQPRWATIDTDGSLLLSSDKDRLASIFERNDLAYRTERQGDRWALEATFPTGEVYQAWLEANPDRPRRTIARIRLKPAEPAQGDRAAIR